MQLRKAAYEGKNSKHNFTDKANNSNNDFMDYELWTVKETAQYLRISHRSLYNMLSAGKCPIRHERIGKAIRFRRADVIR